MLPSLMVDFIISLDGYAAADGWPGFWGLAGPEYLGWLEEQAQHDHQALKALRGVAERELDQRWARNTMLNKWLEYCIDRGHGFRP